MNINCLNPIARIGLDRLGAGYEMTELNVADAVLVRSAVMHELEVPESLLAVGRAGAGTNNIPSADYAKKGIVVFNTPGANANGVKELVLGGLFLGSRGIVAGIEWGKTLTGEGIAKQVEKGKKNFAGTEIKGKTLGVIGLGAIGVEVANAAVALGMNVYGYDPFLSVMSAVQMSKHIHYTQNLDDIYANSDYITIHIPATPETKGTFNEASIAKMKDGVIVLNFARDELTDNAAMQQALESGKVRAYVCDFVNEKTQAMPNCIATPHLGASTAESEENCAIMAVDEIKDFLENGNIRNSVNMPACDMGFKAPGTQRITIIHENIPNMIGQFTSLIASAGVNIPNMQNKSRGEIGYTVMDIESFDGEKFKEALEKVDHVIRVRVI